MTKEPDDQTSSSAGPKAPSRLRFKTLSRRSAPPDFFFIDEALDRLALQLHGDEWRNSMARPHLPLLYRKGKAGASGGYNAFRLEFKRGVWTVAREPFCTTSDERAGIQAGVTMFRSAVAKLKLALYAGTLSGYRHSPCQDEITKAERGILVHAIARYLLHWVCSERAQNWQIRCAHKEICVRTLGCNADALVGAATGQPSAS